MIRQVIDTAYKYDNQPLLLAGLKTAGTSSFAIENYKEAKDYFNKIIKIKESYLNVDILRHMGISHLELGNIDSAIICNNKLRNIDPTDKWLEYKINVKLNNHKGALIALQHELDKHNDVVYNILTQNVSETVTSYHKLENSLHESAFKQERLIKNIVIIGFIFVILSFITTFLYYSKAQKQKIENYILLASELKENLDNTRKKLYIADKRNDISYSNEQQLRKSINILFKERFNDINLLCDEYYSSDDIDKQNKVYNQIKKLMPIEDTPTIIKVKKFINIYKDDLYTKFEQSFPDLKKIDYIIFIYSVVGFSYRTMSFLTNEKIKILYKRHYRLKERISNSNSKHKDDLLAEMM